MYSTQTGFIASLAGLSEEISDSIQVKLRWLVSNISPHYCWLALPIGFTFHKAGGDGGDCSFLFLVNSCLIIQKLDFVDVATGSLGQGLSVAAGMAYTGKHFDKAE